MALYMLQELKEKMQEYFYTKEEIDQMLLDFDIGSLTDLQTLITSASNGDTLILDKNYKYDSTTDNSLTNGIEITKDITIIGNGHIIDANNSKKAFYINGQYTFNLSDVRIQNCSGDNGGAIYAYSATVNITNTTFNQNTATNGGAILADGATVNINNTIFNQNTAKYGGAIGTGNNCNLTVTNCTFKQNTANNSYGGAIYNYMGTLTVTNTTFTENTANNGGAIYTRGTLSIVNCSFKDNTATSYNNIYSANTVVVYDCIIPDISTSCYNVTNKIRTFINYIDAPTSAAPNSSYTISAKVTDINDDPISDIYVDLERSGYTLYRIRTDEDGIVSYTGTASNTFTYSMSVEGDNTYESSGAGEKTLTVT